MKIRSDKTRFQSAANCPSRALFQTVLDQMNKCVPKTSGNGMYDLVWAFSSVCVCVCLCTDGEKERRSSKKKPKAKSLVKDTGSSKASNEGKQTPSRQIY